MPNDHISIVNVLSRLFPDPAGPVASYAEDLFEILGRYFPIHFTHAKDEEVDVKRDELSRALMVAMLGKQCVEEDPILRPDMKQVVISLSQILLSSVEWEATLAGNSKVFSGLVQGR